MSRPTQYTVPTRAGVLSVELSREGISKIGFLLTPWERAQQSVSVCEMEASFPLEEQHATAKHLKWLKRLQEWPGKDTIGIPEDVFSVNGTKFQQTVWAELRKIPRGETRTYAQIAECIGSGPRAVANACAANVFALWVPCHRVVPKRGGEGRYKWGDWRKRVLLGLEQRVEM